MSEGDRIDRAQMIRERAYALWIEDGCPDGQAEQHWRRAAAALDEEEAAVAPPSDPPADPAQMVPPNR